jgi:8-amino-7-oxononanoate synthase
MNNETWDMVKPAALHRFSKTLERLEKRDQKRALHPRVGADFASNDYLGLANDPAIKEAVRDALEAGTPVGAGGSRLLRGNCPDHEALEYEAAAFFGSEQALYFGAGYMANHALLTTLPRQGDLVVYDELIHASSHDGMRGGKATCLPAAHNDLDAYEDVIKAWRSQGHKGQIWIAIETLYSMDGDRADLAGLDALAKCHDAFLLLDEAHASGVFGPDGRCLSAMLEGQEHVIAVHTCGKALGAQGALVCASSLICDYLINRSRPFIYATAPSPLTAVALRKALQIIQQEPERRRKLLDLIAYCGHNVQKLGNFVATGSQIQPIILGENARTMTIANFLRDHGFDVRGIRPPTVADGTARLRLALNIHHDHDGLDALFACLAEALKQTGHNIPEDKEVIS